MLRERIALVLGWTAAEASSFSLPALRELLPAGKLRDEVTAAIRSGVVLLGEP